MIPSFLPNYHRNKGIDDNHREPFNDGNRQYLYISSFFLCLWFTHGDPSTVSPLTL